MGKAQHLCPKLFDAILGKVLCTIRGDFEKDTNLCYSLFEKYIWILEKYLNISGLIQYLAVRTLAQATVKEK